MLAPKPCLKILNPSEVSMVKYIIHGAVEKTRTSTGCPTSTSTMRVYQFRHDRTLT